MHKLMEYICDEIEELERKADKGNKLSMQEIEYLDKLTHIKKSMLSAEEMWEDSDYSEADGSSYRRSGRSYAMGGNGQSRRGGSSYARGRGRNARRDSMGRYSNDGRSYDMSMAEDDFRMELEELMQDAPNEQIKQKIQRLMSEM